MDKKIIAIGGHVIKTAREELKKFVEKGHVEMLIHNGGSIFHDFQLATDKYLAKENMHSYSLDSLIAYPTINKDASELVWKWLDNHDAPEGSITRACEDVGIDVLMFTVFGGDFWQLFRGGNSWSYLGAMAHTYFGILRERLKKPFHYVCMGSAVVHPEVFTKAISGITLPYSFRADVVDFKDMYRPTTRIAKYGQYYKMEHKEYLEEQMRPKQPSHSKSSSSSSSGTENKGD